MLSLHVSAISPVSRRGLLDHEECAAVALAALLHDVGKLTIPRTLRDKPAHLSPQEELAMRQHSAAGARLIAIIDALATMTSSRPYQEARSVSDALLELERCAGTLFDPKLVQQCIASFQTMQHESFMETLYAFVNEWLAERSLGSMTSAWIATETIG